MRDQLRYKFRFPGTIAAALLLFAELQWHVANRGGRFVVTDVQVNGSSMKVSERDQVAGIIQRNGGRPDALLSVMRQQVVHGGREQGRGSMPAGGAVGSSMPPPRQ